MANYKLGTELLVNVKTAGDQTKPDAALLKDGRTIATWIDDGQLKYRFGGGYSSIEMYAGEKIVEQAVSVKYNREDW